MKKPLKAVVDTNVWLSALYFLGKPAKIVGLIEEKSLTSVISEFILNELRDKMVNDFQTPGFVANGTISYIQSISKSVNTSEKDFGLRDSSDNQILETAINGKCQFLITGDKDLLVLEQFDKLQIVTPGEFLRLLDESVD